MMCFMGTDVEVVAFLVLVLAVQFYWELRAAGARP
jgi:hypothetical protein